MNKYNRLTERKEDREYLKEEFWYSANEPSVEEIDEIYKRLAELEDKIENGTLVELPCKVGDTVYVLDEDRISGNTKINEAIVCDYNISSYDYSIEVKEKNYTYYLFNCGLGFDWFTNKAEAEAKLKELQGEKK